MEEWGKRHWVFTDGDLPPAGDADLQGHEALIITNAGEEDAHLLVDVLFEDRAPHKAGRRRCFFIARLLSAPKENLYGETFKICKRFVGYLRPLSPKHIVPERSFVPRQEA